MKFFGEDVWFCQYSPCKDNCGEILSRCSCHPSCVTYNSCCHDYGKSCIERDNNGTSANASIALDSLMPPMKEPDSFSSCISVYNNKRQENVTYNFIDKCPSDADVTLSSMCDDRNTKTDLRRVVPVSSNQTLFINIYCAQCHGIKAAELAFWQPTFNCPTLSKPIVSSTKSYIRHMMTYCKLQLIPPTNALLANAAECEADKMVSRCPSVSQEGDKISNLLAMSCLRYKSVVQSTDGVKFRNPHCAICNAKTMNELMCKQTTWYRRNKPALDLLPTFSMLIDFTSTSGIVINSPDGLLSLSTECPPNAVLEDGECVESSPKPSCLPQIPTAEDNVYYIYVNITLTSPQRFYIVITNIFRFIPIMMSGALSQDSEIESNVCDRSDNITFVCSVRLKFRYEEGIDEQFLEKTITRVYSYLNLLGRLYQINRPKDFKAYLTNQRVGFESVCRFGVVKTYFEDDFTFVRENGTEYISVLNTHDLYNLRNIVFGIDFDGIGSARAYITVCETTLPKRCAKAKLTPDRYRRLNESSVLVLPLGVVTSDFEMCGDAVMICKENLTSLKPVPESVQGQGFQGELTLVGNCLSLSCLTFTLVVHIAVPRLRTVPGRCIMCLSLSLFCAQLTFQFSAIASADFGVCISLAMVQHYFWLASFCWMSVLAYDLSSTFSGGGKILDPVEKERVFRYYNLFSWSIPFIIVSISLSMHFTRTAIIYSSVAVCWINGSRNLLLSFVLPLSLSLLLNSILFVRCVVGIYRAKKIAHTAKKGSKLDLLIYIKLSSLMGFTWISGFIVNAAQVPELWYLFIVCNSLQGVFICLCFALNPSFLRNICKKCVGKPDTSAQTSVSVIVSRTDKTNI